MLGEMDTLYLFKQENSFRMGEIEKNRKEIMKVLDKDFKDDPILKKYIKASQEFKKLVEEGLVEKRGHNLRAPEDLHLAPYNFNTR